VSAPERIPARADSPRIVNGGGATVAIRSGRDRQIAYHVATAEKSRAWLQGPCDQRQAGVDGQGNASRPTYGGGKATGTVTVHGKTYTFTGRPVKAPSGLYKASAQLRGATVQAGWIVLA